MKQISPKELQDWINEHRKFTLIDVREGFERELYSIGGLHIPLGELMSRRNELPKEETLVFYCEKGIRSQIALQRLEDLGYDMYNLSGGMYAWRAM
ncbi:rhodanese-like domain-containing protein [Chitinophagaceae bacterium MMS25-I14]